MDAWTLGLGRYGPGRDEADETNRYQRRQVLGAAAVALWLAAVTLWSSPAQAVEPEFLRFPSTSPFSLNDAGAAAPLVEAEGFYLPPDAPSTAPVPAVVLLHGAGGILRPRELAYAEMFSAAGWGALVIDAFGSRVEPGTGFTERLLDVTEAMILADAYAGLSYLSDRPEIDARRVGLVGFSLGGMVTTYALHRQVAERFAADGQRFRAHVAFYAPCIARFADRRTTGAPLLMLYGTGDAIVDPKRCDEVAGDARNGGSLVSVVAYPGALHQWDGWASRPWRAPRGLRHCQFQVGEDGVVRDQNSFLTLSGYAGRTLALALCSDDAGYLIGRDDGVRRQSDRELMAFLRAAFADAPLTVDGR